MRLLTHNSLRNTTADAKGRGFPLHITCGSVRISDGSTASSSSSSMDADQQMAFVQKMLPNLDWPALVQGATAMGIATLPPILSEELASDKEFLAALFHILMNVHLVEGTLTCPVTGRQFRVENEIPNMVIEDGECERIN